MTRKQSRFGELNPGPTVYETSDDSRENGDLGEACSLSAPFERPCLERPGDVTHYPGRRRSRQEVTGAHRASWEDANGRRVPEGYDVCHRCDNRRCVEPSHLYLGTRSENMMDARDRGRLRVPYGVAITLDRARQIRQMHASGMSRRDIAAVIGCSYKVVKDVVRGHTWRERRSA